MNPVVYTQINGFAILMLCALLVASADENSVSDNGIFHAIIWMVMAILAVDLALWSLDGNTAGFVRPLLWCLHMLYFMLTELISASWLVYVYEMIHGEGSFFRARRRRIAWLLPLVAFLILISLSPIFASVFSLDAQNRYSRGNLFFIQYIVGFAYLLSASLLALRQRSREEQAEKKREYLTVATFAIYPLVGGVLQILFYGTVLLWPFTVAAIFMVSSHLHRAQVSVDALTQLNNRRRFDRYLATSMRSAHAARARHLILFDVDDFKQINDRFGHTTGDQALRETAQALRATFGQNDAFIARYGGDEFVVVLSGVDDAEVRRMIERFQLLCREAGGRGGPYTLNVSAGAVRCDDKHAARPEELINLADFAMYQQKAERKQAPERA